ncbi:MAG: acetyl-CoA carboxylase biotin carboxyl carrier protein subunit [Clostridiales bacterium]|uniref:biotin/lipoyl-containing protein n=1 Tax=Clostridium sp. N3C TaxID=1776758 RepID=UPI00092E1BB3|nr:biotin/lipoyl-containing protein [Clostridium sp. N3C]NLZ48335.1 acetyl-CoA carboxylase biotin carboxyl carrier protein subunit [Clostridiales bacterium]SCN23155.1 Glutaconyl-CoA decarboxylase subunit gamma [Clostridium sp. N3C]
MKKYYVTVNGKKYAVEVEEVKGDLVIPETSKVSANTEKLIDNTEIQTKVEEPKVVESTVVSKEPVEGEKIECPMPGTIIRIPATEGSSLKKGDVIMILEAMKMENEIMAPRDCKVLSINVAKGEQVNTGDILAVIE